MEILKTINATVAFGLELITYAIFAIWGYSLKKGGFMRWMFAVGMLIIAIVIWGLFAAPSATYSIPKPEIYLFELVFTLVAALAAYKLSYKKLAYTVAVLACACQLLAFIFKQ